MAGYDIEFSSFKLNFFVFQFNTSKLYHVVIKIGNMNVEDYKVRHYLLITFSFFILLRWEISMLSKNKNMNRYIEGSSPVPVSRVV